MGTKKKFRCGVFQAITLLLKDRYTGKMPNTPEPRQISFLLSILLVEQ